MIEFDSDIAADESTTLFIDHNVNGFLDSDAVHIDYHTGDLQVGDENQVVHILLDETGASGGEVDVISVETTDATALEKHALHIGTGFDEALHVSGAVAADPDYGYTVASSTVVDRVNSGGGGNDAFINSAVDEEIFSSDNDYILIGSDATFEVIEYTANTGSSHDLLITFFYSKAGDNWTALPGVNESTSGFQHSGIISWSAPGDWTKDDEAEANGDITDAFYIKIVRTRNGDPPTDAVEDHFDIFAAMATGMTIRGNGVVKLPYLAGAPDDLENGLIWMESDGLHTYYGDAEHILTD